MKDPYQNPEKYKEHLKQEEDEHWELAQSGGINEEMNESEAIRKRDQADKERKAEEAKVDHGPNFPKVWDLNYFPEDPHSIFKKSINKIDWDFFNFKIFVDEKNFFMSNFFGDFDELKWLNTEKIEDFRKTKKFNIKEKFFNALAAMYVLTWKSGFIWKI